MGCRSDIERSEGGHDKGTCPTANGALPRACIVRWRRRPRPIPSEPLDPAALLVEECEAFLVGAYPACLARHGVDIPSWAWLNPLAHGSSDELTALAAHQDGEPGGEGSGWPEVVAALATELLSGDGPCSRQRGALVPLELQLAADHTPIATPDDLYQAVRAALERPAG
jgi:hypothetical protein